MGRTSYDFRRLLFTLVLKRFYGSRIHIYYVITMKKSTIMDSYLYNNKYEQVISYCCGYLFLHIGDDVHGSPVRQKSNGSMYIGPVDAAAAFFISFHNRWMGKMISVIPSH